MDYHAVTSGQSLADAATITQVWTGNGLKPHKVSDVRLSQDGNGDFLIQFTGHPRVPEIPADYQVEVWSSADRSTLANRKRVLPTTTGTTHAVLLDSSGNTIYDAGDAFDYLQSPHATLNNLHAGTGFASAQTLETLTSTFSRFDFTFRVDNNAATGSGTLAVAGITQDATFNTSTRAPVAADCPVFIEWAENAGNIRETIKSFGTTVGTPRDFTWGATGVKKRYTILLAGTEYRVYENYGGQGSVPLVIIASASTGYPFPLRLKMQLIDLATGPFNIDNIVSGGAIDPSTIYAKRDQLADFGAQPATLYLRIRQKGVPPRPDGWPYDIAVQTVGGFVLLETGDHLLLETGDKLLKE